MKKVIFGAALAFAAAGCAALQTPPPKSAGQFTVATFNVRCPGDKGDNRWYLRMPRVAAIVRDYGFDLFGVQEAVPFEMAILTEELPGFSFVGCGRGKNRDGEGMYIFYRTDRFKCLESDTFWLSKTPDEPGSKYPGAGCPRTCTWALLEDLRTGRKFRYFNTHLDHISSKARWDGMQVLLNLGVRPAKSRGETVLLTGDLNATLEETDDPAMIAKLQGPVLSESAKTNPIALVSTELRDTYAASGSGHKGPHKTFHGFKGEPRCRLDYIFATPDVRVYWHATIDDRPGGGFASDHYPVAATISL
ncbi:MAG: endonuclease/exonuclease/phosphatase family protein [Kiritimatiellae bacterium]|nr:endonuclease/exonuclease/phosphatase family protein [Kiritimatiellia bacterium]